MFEIEVVDKIKTHFMLINFFFRKSCLFFWIIFKYKVEPDRPQIKIWPMRTACCITRATNTHSQYVILIAFPLQQCLHERASMLRYTYIACLVISYSTQRNCTPDSNIRNYTDYFWFILSYMTYHPQRDVNGAKTIFHLANIISTYTQPHMAMEGS